MDVSQPWVVSQRPWCCWRYFYAGAIKENIILFKRYRPFNMIYCSLPDMPASCTTDLLVYLNKFLFLIHSLFPDSLSLEEFPQLHRKMYISSILHLACYFCWHISTSPATYSLIPLHCHPNCLLYWTNWLHSWEDFGLGGSYRWHALNNSLADIPDSLLSLLCLSVITAFIIVYFIACLPGTLFNIV